MLALNYALKMGDEIILTLIRRLLKKYISTHNQFKVNNKIIRSVSQGELFSYKGFKFVNIKNGIGIEFSLLDSDQSNFESILLGKIIPDIIRLGGCIEQIKVITDDLTATGLIKFTGNRSKSNGYNSIFKLFVEKDYHITFPSDFKKIFEGFISKENEVSVSELIYLINLWKERWDLQKIYGEIDLNSMNSLIVWWVKYGIKEYNEIDVKVKSSVQNNQNILVNTQQFRDWLSLQLLGTQGFELGPGFQPLKYRNHIDVKYIEKNYFIEKSSTESLKSIDLTPQLISCDIESQNFLNMISDDLDFISSSHVFEHLHYPLNFIENTSKRMKNGSQILFIVPDRDFTFDQGRSRDSFEYYFSDNSNFNKPLQIDNVLRAQKFYQPKEIPDSDLIKNLLETTTHFYSYNLPEFVGLLISQMYHGRIKVRMSNLYSPFQIGYEGLEFGVIIDIAKSSDNEVDSFGIFSSYISLIQRSNIYSEVFRLQDLIKTLEQYCSFKNIFENLSPYSTFEYFLWFLNQEIIEKNFVNLYSVKSLGLYLKNPSNFRGVNRAVYSIKNAFTEII